MASFGFPYPPYAEQLRLMTAIYDCIESSSVGCFESPTGTGKSLSSICSSFTWLLEEEKRVLGRLATSSSPDEKPTGSDDWLADIVSQKSTTNSESKTKELIDRHNSAVKRISNSNNKLKTLDGKYFQRPSHQTNAKEVKDTDEHKPGKRIQLLHSINSIAS